MCGVSEMTAYAVIVGRVDIETERGHLRPGANDQAVDSRVDSPCSISQDPRLMRFAESLWTTTWYCHETIYVSPGIYSGGAR